MKPQISFVFIVYAIIFKPELVYQQNTQTGHKKLENKSQCNVYYSVEDNNKFFGLKKSKKMQKYADIYLL